MAIDKRPIDEAVGAAIARLRREAGWAEEDLASSLDCNLQQLRELERGSVRANASTLFRISQALGVPVYRFFEQEPRPPERSDGQDETIDPRN